MRANDHSQIPCFSICLNWYIDAYVTKQQKNHVRPCGLPKSCKMLISYHHFYQESPGLLTPAVSISLLFLHPHYLWYYLFIDKGCFLMSPSLIPFCLSIVFYFRKQLLHLWFVFVYSKSDITYVVSLTRWKMCPLVWHHAKLYKIYIVFALLGLPAGDLAEPQ